MPILKYDGSAAALTAAPSKDYFGTSGLRPITATQGNLSVEWYYRPRSALGA